MRAEEGEGWLYLGPVLALRGYSSASDGCPVAKVHRRKGGDQEPLELSLHRKWPEEGLRKGTYLPDGSSSEAWKP